MHWVRGCGVDGVQRDQEEHDEKRQEPCVSQTGIGEPVEEGAAATSLGLGLGGLFLCAIELLAGLAWRIGCAMKKNELRHVPSELVMLARSDSLRSLWTSLVRWCHLGYPRPRLSFPAGGP